MNFRERNNQHAFEELSDPGLNPGLYAACIDSSDSAFTGALSGMVCHPSAVLRYALLFLVFEFISYASERNDEFSVWAEAVAEILYVSIYSTVIAKEIVSPDIREKLVS